MTTKLHAESQKPAQQPWFGDRCGQGSVSSVGGDTVSKQRDETEGVPAVARL